MEQEQKTINNTKLQALENIKAELEGIKNKKEVYFHDLVTSSVDSNTPQETKEAILFSEYTGNEEYADEGILDKSSINRFAVTMAYECLNQSVFDDDFFQELQELLNNEEVSKKKAKEIIEKIDKYIKDNELTETPIEIKESNTQIHITLKGDRLKQDDFNGHKSFNQKQIMDLSDGTIKILTSSKEINKNALVLEPTNIKKYIYTEPTAQETPYKRKVTVKDNETLYRVYLMERSKEIDIRELFKFIPNSIAENNYSLRVEDYTKGKKLRYFDDKKELLKHLGITANKLTAYSTGDWKPPKQEGLITKTVNLGCKK